jgi:di- and tripeptidase
LETGAGDLFSLSWSSTLQTIFVGCQNTSLQWYNFQDAPAQSNSPLIAETPSSSGLSTPTTNIASRKAHKFFDSYPQYEHKPADLNANNGSPLKLSRRGSPTLDSDFPRPREYLKIPISNVIDSAHYGYVYCTAIIKNNERVRLATGSGDETVKVIFKQTP